MFRGFKNNAGEKNTITTTPLIGTNNFNWNTVEGFNYRYGISYRKKINDDQRLTSKLLMRYGLSNRQFNAKLSTNYFFGKTNKSQLSLSGGRYVFQYSVCLWLGEVSVRVGECCLCYNTDYMCRFVVV